MVELIQSAATPPVTKPRLIKPALERPPPVLEGFEDDDEEEEQEIAQNSPQAVSWYHYFTKNLQTMNDERFRQLTLEERKCEMHKNMVRHHVISRRELQVLTRRTYYIEPKPTHWPQREENREEEVNQS
jgi:hypothetical protein